MPKIVFMIASIFVIFLTGLVFLTPTTYGATGNCLNPRNSQQILSTATWPDRAPINKLLKITVNFTSQTTPGGYFVIISDGRPIGATDYKSQLPVMLTPDQLIDGEQRTFDIPIGSQVKNYYVKLQKEGVGDVCSPSNFGNIEIHLPEPDLPQVGCFLSAPANVQIGSSFTVQLRVSNIPSANSIFESLIFKREDFARLPKRPTIRSTIRDFPRTLVRSSLLLQENQVQDITYSTATGELNQIGDFTTAMVVLDDATKPLNQSVWYICDAKDFKISHEPTSSPTPGRPGMAAPLQQSPSPSLLSPSAAGQRCNTGFTDAAGNPALGIATAIGCVPTEPVALIKALLRFVLAIVGGISFLLMIMGVFQMITSAGNQDTLKSGVDRLTSAIIGILFIVFSVLLLQIIGSGILKIPGFSP